MTKKTETVDLQAGVACVDITPQAGTYLAGDVGRYRPAQIVLDPLYAKILILQKGNQKICIVALDLTMITRKYTKRIRKIAADKIGINPDAVMVHAIQSHSAPSLGYFMIDQDFKGISLEKEWMLGGEEDYCQYALKQIKEGIEIAASEMQPAQIAVGSAMEGCMAFNRRAVIRNGKVKMPKPRSRQDPLGDTDILYLEGPIDPELGLIAIRREDLSMISVLVNYTCHPTSISPRAGQVSADWPGALSREIAVRYGAGCIPLVLNGCCGNINPNPAFDARHIVDHRHMGHVLDECAEKIIPNLIFGDVETISSAVKHIQIPFRSLDARLLQESEDIINKHPEPPWVDTAKTRIDRRWCNAASVISLYKQIQREKVFNYEIQVLRVGDIAIVGLPGEPFVEGQLHIKMESPVRYTYVVHNVSHHAGYIPIKEGVGRGGHEDSPAYWSKFAPQALDIIVRETITLLKDVF